MSRTIFQHKALVLAALTLIGFMLTGILEINAMTGAVERDSYGFSSVRENAIEALPVLGCGLACMFAWLYVCKWAYRDHLQQIQGRNYESVDAQLAALRSDLAASAKGSEADQMFFAGTMASMLGMFIYCILKFLGMSPIQFL